jgi:hypothetical protein
MCRDEQKDGRRICFLFRQAVNVLHAPARMEISQKGVYIHQQKKLGMKYIVEQIFPLRGPKKACEITCLNQATN